VGSDTQVTGYLTNQALSDRRDRILLENRIRSEDNAINPD